MHFNLRLSAGKTLEVVALSFLVLLCAYLRKHFNLRLSAGKTLDAVTLSFFLPADSADKKAPQLNAE
jgi:hypothetical protein